MKIYLDDCSDADSLGAALLRAGHEVITPRTEKLIGADDPIHLAYAARNGAALLTKNPGDFRELHDQYQLERRTHSGILLVYQERLHSNNPSVSMIVSAIRNLEASGIPIANAVHNLNHWR